MRVLVVDAPQGLLMGAAAELAGDVEIHHAADRGQLGEVLGRVRFDAVLVADTPLLGTGEVLDSVRWRQPAAERLVLPASGDDGDGQAYVDTAHGVLSSPPAVEELRLRLLTTVARGPMVPGPLAEVVGGAVSLPSVAGLLEEARAVFDDDRSGTAELAGVLSKDPALSAKVLHLANAGFVRREIQITDIPQATALLGMTAMRRVVLTGVAFRAAEELGADADLVEQAQRHGLAASNACRTTPGLPEHAPMGALLMDIGLPLMALAWPEEHAEVRTRCAVSGARLVEEERRVLGVTHADAGAALAHRWELPYGVADMIGGHHLVPAEDTPADVALGFLVHFAAQQGGGRAVDPWEPDLTDQVPDWLLPRDSVSA